MDWGNWIELASYGPTTDLRKIGQETEAAEIDVFISEIEEVTKTIEALDFPYL